MYAGFFLLGIVRGLGYYAFGAAGSRWTERAGRASAALAKGLSSVRRWGAWSVVGTYPFYGLAGATQLACGVLRIPMAPFIGALCLVSSLWAALQTALGVAVLESLARGAWPVVAGIVVVLIAIAFGRRALASHVG
jgi:membrane protein DedA with SNARE-associated domain